MDDNISRQAAIDALDVLCQEHRYKIPGKGETYSQYNEAWQDALDRAEGAIFNLPPTQPEKRTETHGVCLDAISRQAAIDICDNVIDLFRGQFGAGVLVAIKESIEELPSAQPDSGLQKLADEIAKYKRTMRSSNSDYFTGYMSALSMVEGIIADMMPHEPCEGVTE